MIVKTYLPKVKTLQAFIHSFCFLYENQKRSSYIAFPNTIKSILIGIDTTLTDTKNTITSNPAKGSSNALLLDTAAANKLVINNSSVILQINFLSIGLCRFIQLPISNINAQQNQVFFSQLQYLSKYYGQSAETNVLKKLEAMLVNSLCKRDTTQIVQAIDLMDTSTHIKTIAKEVNMTYQTLYRNFKKYVGMTPSMYQRIARFRAVLMSDENELKTFYDESHMIREFKFFTGYTPNAYKKNIKQTMSNFYHQQR